LANPINILVKLFTPDTIPLHQKKWPARDTYPSQSMKNRPSNIVLPLTAIHHRSYQLKIALGYDLSAKPNFRCYLLAYKGSPGFVESYLEPAIDPCPALF
jgi:hypothetical protein